MTLEAIRSCAVEIIELVDGLLPGDPPTQPPSGDRKLQTFVQLFGPTQGQGALTQGLPSSYAFLGNALTSSTKRFWFDRGLLEVDYAIFQVVWTSSSLDNKLRLIKCKDGPSEIEQICEISPSAPGNPVVSGAFVTEALQDLVLAGEMRHLGFQGKGPGTATIYEVRIEVVWKILE